LDEILGSTLLDPRIFLFCPYLLAHRGCHPETGTFMWFSILESPEVNLSSNSETKSDHYYSAQINMSWPTKSDAGPTPPSNRERLALMNLHAANIHPVLRQAIEDIPEGTEIKEIRLADWPCLDWPNFEGKVTLLGDAAHAMTMCTYPLPLPPCEC